jgi:hypothetical protein
MKTPLSTIRFENGSKLLTQSAEVKGRELELKAGTI